MHSYLIYLQMLSVVCFEAMLVSCSTLRQAYYSFTVRTFVKHLTCRTVNCV